MSVGELRIIDGQVALYMGISIEEKGKLLFSEIERNPNFKDCTLGAPHIWHEKKTEWGITTPWYSFEIKVPSPKIQQFKDFLLGFCKKHELDTQKESLL